jgi:hypothetical protein
MAKKKKAAPTPPPDPKTYVYVAYHESKSGGEVREGMETTPGRSTKTSTLSGI